jgi:hypothetical protein
MIRVGNSVMSGSTLTVLFLTGLLATTIAANAQTVANPPEQQVEKTQASTNEPPTQSKTLELPPIVVQGQRVSPFAEEQLVGPYQQPEWTTERRFPTTRIYLQEQPYEMGVEQWDRIRAFKDGTVEHRFSEEYELGLPHRFQMDAYYTWKAGSEAIAGPHNVAVDEESIEFRYAFADWGQLPMNPTLYVEYTFATGGDADALEGKLLLGDEICQVWHYGVNFICEQGLWGDCSTELAASAALGRTIIDRKLGLGIEAEYSNTTVAGSRGDPEVWFLLGPSAQWRITPKLHLDCVPLFGMTHDSPRTECWVVLGYDFGSGTGKETPVTPISTKGN